MQGFWPSCSFVPKQGSLSTNDRQMISEAILAAKDRFGDLHRLYSTPYPLNNQQEVLGLFFVGWDPWSTLGLVLIPTFEIDTKRLTLEIQSYPFTEQPGRHYMPSQLVALLEEVSARIKAALGPGSHPRVDSVTT